MSPDDTKRQIDALFKEPIASYPISSAFYRTTPAKIAADDLIVIDEAPPLGFTEALLHGAEAVIPLSRSRAIPIEAYQGPLPENGPGRIIDGGTVEMFVNTLAVYDSATDPGAGSQSEPEYFLDQVHPGGIWYLIPDADRLAWNDYCAVVEPIYRRYIDEHIELSAEEEDLVATPSFAKPLLAHPRWTVFKSPRQKFS
ncbi:hypothetical protein HOU03_gp097 [Caulobacter phage CcrSC]|uniref:Uncharacterized protein n=1 Tax=Caulobacter phage CcrSC TaxID=2283272 RepID=A0A385EG12_9CAUD|nr:hypothetical protein HOU03_gp097 [Caulobacter phage CcrSC]AXQ69679.1 hypothetical protein CcrSC_gp097 [Caulobacter phage CcrSC]